MPVARSCVAILFVGKQSAGSIEIVRYEACSNSPMLLPRLTDVVKEVESHIADSRPELSGRKWSLFCSADGLPEPTTGCASTRKVTIAPFRVIDSSKCPNEGLAVDSLLLPYFSPEVLASHSWEIKLSFVILDTTVVSAVSPKIVPGTLIPASGTVIGSQRTPESAYASKHFNDAAIKLQALRRAILQRKQADLPHPAASSGATYF
eukprot:GILI01025257.1.p1 GENE.GILI01025257.1~~GILI01025257.1.p1  ORF type:complete len:206 (-),score=9.20 GILI01025257.1:55-672(-)